MPEDIVDPERLVREVTFAVEGDGRTIEARIVPYNTDTQVVDAPHNGGTGVPYLERWLPGAFERQVTAAHRVWLNVEHEPGFRAVVGHGVALREAPDALYGTFRVEPGDDGNKALHMVNQGVLTGLSIEAIPRTSRTVAGIVERVKAHLDKVSLVREGLAAYKGAEVLAVRENTEAEEFVEYAVSKMAPNESEANEHIEFFPEPPNPERANDVDETLKRMGFESLVRRSVVTRTWNGAPARFTDEEYERSTLIHRAGDDPPKERCSLPVLEPNGDVNTNALGQASARINQITGVTSSQRSSAARKLLRYYRQAGMDPPESLRTLARR